LRERARVPARGYAGAAPGRAPGLHPDDRGARRARYRRFARRAGGQDRILERVQTARPLVGGASSVLSRAAAGAALLAGLLAYYVWRESLPQLGQWRDIALLALVLIPAVFALVGLVLPFRDAVGLLPVGLAAIVLAIVCQKAGWGIPANFVKLGATTTLAFWFLGYFESALWVALIALIVPWVDAYSVWRGPT